MHRHHLHHQHSADLAYQLSIYQLQAVKCCLSLFKWARHARKNKKTTSKNRNMNPSSFFFTSIFFQIRHTVQHSKLFFLQYLFWFLTSKDVDTEGPSMTKRTNRAFLFLFFNRKHRTVSRSLLAFICPNLNIKGSFPLQFPPLWLLNLLCDLCISLFLWPFLSVMTLETITGYPIQHKALNSSSHESYRS